MRTATANAVAQMILEARPFLGVELATHLVGNAVSAYVMAEEVPLDPHEDPLPLMRTALEDRVLLDRKFRASHPDTYPHDYQIGSRLDDLLDRMALIWDRRNAFARDMLRDVERLHAELGIVFSVRLEGGRWYVEAERRVAGAYSYVRDDHPILEVALGEVLRSI